MNAELLAKAKAWLAQDPDPETRAELEAIIGAGDEDELAKRFESRLEFGTAGLRGELGAGPNRMNRVLVAQAALGFAEYLLETSAGDCPSVAIGYDARKNSEHFARDSAEIMAGNGIRVLLFEKTCPTPMLAFAVKHLALSGGVMVTASHNPANDNGYKVYLGGGNGGSQIIPPADLKIAAHIERIATTITVDKIPRHAKFELVGDKLVDDYIGSCLNATSGLRGPARDVDSHNRPRIIYTAMHGVGWATLKPLFEAAWLETPDIVEEQIQPDSKFPTVAFPNPEEPGAMDLSFARARELHADLVIANDPDADRLAVGIPDESTDAGYRRLTGDEVGLILGDWAASKAKQEGRAGALACSIVSSSALEKVAQAYGLEFRQTLTGFKWISKVPGLVFGYEEALGYCIDPTNIPDKDGISAALAIASLVNALAQQGTDLGAHLEALQNRYGFFATGQVSIRVNELAEISRVMKKLREHPPTSIDNSQTHFTDLLSGSFELMPTDALQFNLADGRRVIVRPSGTEPKLKCYLQAVGSSKTQADELLSSLDASMREILAAI